MFKIFKLGEVCSIESGSRGKGGALTEGIPSIGGEQISSAGYVLTEKMKYITEEHFKKMKQGILKSGDILLVKDGATTGKCAFYRNEYNEAAINEHVFLLRANNLILPKLLYYVITSDKFQSKIKSSIKGIIGGINLSIKNLEIAIPDTLEEQQEIVQVLDTMNDIIRLREECISHAQDLIPALFQEMFQNHENNTIFLSDICDIKGGKRLPQGEKLIDEKTNHPYIRVTNFKNQSVDLSDIKYITEEVYQKISRYIITTNDIYISIAGTIGLVGDIPDEFNNANLTENAAKLILKDNNVNTKYLIYCLNSPYLQQQIKESTVGVGVPKLALARIGTLKVYLPPIELQEQFAQKAIEIESYIKEQKEELENAKQMFQSLLHHAFTGELTRRAYEN